MIPVKIHLVKANPLAGTLLLKERCGFDSARDEKRGHFFTPLVLCVPDTFVPMTSNEIRTQRATKVKIITNGLVSDAGSVLRGVSRLSPSKSKLLL